MKALALAAALLAEAPLAAQVAEVAPNENLVADGLAKIPAGIADAAARYTELRSAVFMGWHPTRREMLILTRFGDAPQVHAVKSPAGARTQLTFFPDRVAGASYGPKNEGSFVFSKDVGGGEFFQLYRFDRASGDIALITDGKSRNTGASWSTSGDRIAYTSTRRNGADNDLYVMDPLDAKTDKMLAQVEGGGWSVQDWSPDDRTLVVSQRISANESYLWTFDVGTGERKLLTPKATGNETVSYGGAQFAADGRSLFVSTDKGSEFQRLARLDLATGKETYLTSDIPGDVGDFSVSRDGKTVAVVTNEDGVDVLRFLDAATGKLRPGPVLPKGVIGGIEWRENGKELGLTLSSARSPADAYSVEATSNTLERWTESETGGLNAATFAEPELVRWKSFDGKMISGFLYLPPARFTGPRPLMIDIHGGPESQSRPSFKGRSNYYLNEMGIALLFPNVRGSSGYGKTFLTLDNGVLREDSVKDVGAALDWVGTRKDLDADRIAITGGSYGGYMTLAIATHYNDKIRCSVEIVGISNFITFLEKTESYRRDLRRVEYGDERDPKMREFFERIAPMNNATRIAKPLYVLQGRNDPRVPYTESEQIVATVRKNQIPVWYLLAKDEGHGFAKKKNQDFALYSTVAFLQEYLLK